MITDYTVLLKLKRCSLLCLYALLQSVKNYCLCFTGTLYAQSPNGALQASRKTSVTSDVGKVTINLNPAIIPSASAPAFGKSATGSPGPDPEGPPASAPGILKAMFSSHAYFQWLHSVSDSMVSKLLSQLCPVSISHCFSGAQVLQISVYTSFQYAI